MKPSASSTAVAIFVKTPGLSPIKTRLAKTLGTENTAKFYELSVLAIHELVLNAVKVLDISPYWAVAEKGGLVFPQWKTFPKLVQGEGDLGARLCSVYSDLLKKHTNVILIGVDCPQMRLVDFSSTIQKLTSFSFVIGKSLDGGFYLFGGNREVTSEIWNSVPYSVETTTQRLVEKLSVLGNIDYIDTRFDIDTEEELSMLSHHPSDGLLPHQLQVISWAQTLKR